MSRPVSVHPAEIICAVMKRIYDANMTTVSGGNLSIMDDEGNMWISPSGNDKAALSISDISQVLPDGTTIGKHKTSIEYPIHRQILLARPDIKAVLHAHSPALVTMSLLRQIPKIAILPTLRRLCGGEIGIAPYAKPGSEMLVENVSQVFALGCNTVILENHGIFIGSSIGLFEAFETFETLDFAARMELNAPLLSGMEANELNLSQIAIYESFLASTAPDQFTPIYHTGEELLLRHSIAKISKRAYIKQLFTSTQGVVSARVGKSEFVITPKGCDRAYVEVDDLVSVNRDGACEPNKMPDETYLLHKKIYDTNEDVMSVMIACPPHAMTFAITNTPYDVRLIPECFVRLRETKKFPFETLYTTPQQIADYISLTSPVAMIENNCFIIASMNPFAAFDRFEILEYTAKSVLYSKSIGKNIVNINESQLEELRSNVQPLKAPPVDLSIL